MKTSTVLQKIKNQYNNGDLDFDELVEALGEACSKTIIKERKSLIKKFAKGYDLNAEDVEKKILAKKNRHITEEKILKYIDLFSKQPVIYKTLLKNGKEYRCEMTTYGMIYDVGKDKIKAVGYINSNNQPVFIRQRDKVTK